ncbi:MAG: thioredoxin-disulfide reductase [Chloroflexi bacterium]|nr:thioredoxin-disulfide reductase [Chloroflexota bacterium]
MDFKMSSLNPVSNAQVQAEAANQDLHDLIIIGGGPAGLTAALYAARGGIRPLVLTGNVPGGQISSTERMENFPGFPDGINGGELAQRLQDQVQGFGVPMIAQGVKQVNFSSSPFELTTSSAKYRARSVIIATGAFPRRLGVAGESEFFGRGVSTCATCDGFFYQDRRVAVVGGGDSAIEEGLFLTKFASEVVVVHRRDQLRATQILQERAFANPKMRFLWDTVVEEILGEQTVTGIRIRNLKTGETSTLKTDGVFVYVGLIPATKIFADQLELDENGYIVTDRKGRTSVPGVFAAGDVQNPDYRQAVIAAGSGAAVAMEVERYLSEHTG